MSWKLFALGMVLAPCGALCLFILMRQWESSCRLQSLPLGVEPPSSTITVESSVDESLPTITFPDSKTDFAKIELQESLLASQEQCATLQSDLEAGKRELDKLLWEKNQHQQQMELLNQELIQYKRAAKEKLLQQEASYHELKQQVSDNHKRVEELLKEIERLEGRERDLNYEIKTLLQFPNDENTTLEALDFEDNVKDELVVKRSDKKSKK